MHAMRSISFRKVELLRQQLAERDAAIAERERIIAEKEEQLNERERVIAVRDAELYAKTLQIENLKAQLAILRRSRYGRSSEKLDQEIEQLELLLGELEEGVAEGRTRAEQIAKSPTAPRRDKRKGHTPHGRKPLPEHLPREEIVHPPASSCTCCGGTVLRKVGTHRTEVLEYVPSSFKVTVHLRDALRPRPDDCGSRFATSDPGRDRRRRRPSIAIRAIAKARTRKLCSLAVAAFFMPTATEDSNRCMSAIRRPMCLASLKLHAGAMRAVRSTNSMNPRSRPWLGRCWSGSPRCSKSRRESMVRCRSDAWWSAKQRRFRSWPNSRAPWTRS